MPQSSLKVLQLVLETVACFTLLKKPGLAQAANRKLWVAGQREGQRNRQSSVCICPATNPLYVSAEKVEPCKACALLVCDMVLMPVWQSLVLFWMYHASCKCPKGASRGQLVIQAMSIEANVPALRHLSRFRLAVSRTMLAEVAGWKVVFELGSHDWRQSSAAVYLLWYMHGL